MAHIGFIGTGAIAQALVEALAGQGHRLFITQRSESISARLADRFDDVHVLPAEEVVAQASIVIPCLMADVARDVLPGLPFRADQVILSVMADVPLADLRTLCAPAASCAIFIPLPFVAQGGCPLPVTPDSPALRTLLGARNTVIPCRDEAALNAHFAACALASVTFAQMQTTAQWLAGHTGDAEGAEAYVKALLGGYIPCIDTLDAALADLSTEGGFNATLRAHMAAANAALREGLEAFEARLGL